jgi:uncharacterized protein
MGTDGGGRVDQLVIATEHGEVPAILDHAIPGGGRALLLAHGAGAGQASPWMVGLRRRIASRGHSVMTFDYRYMARGARAPDRLPRLMDVHVAAARHLATVGFDVAFAGKSMGGRVGGHVVAERGYPAMGLCYLGYPLVAVGKTEPRDTGHLNRITQPQLFISGDRDRLGPIEGIRALAREVPDGSLVVVEGGDHSLVPLKSSGRTVEDALDGAADVLSAWLHALPPLAALHAGGGT